MQYIYIYAYIFPHISFIRLWIEKVNRTNRTRVKKYIELINQLHTQNRKHEYFTTCEISQLVRIDK